MIKGVLALSKTAEYLHRWREAPDHLIQIEIEQHRRDRYNFEKGRLSRPSHDVKAIQNSRRNIARLMTILSERRNERNLKDSRQAHLRESPGASLYSAAQVFDRDVKATEMAMSTYKFAWDFKSGALRNTDFPVEVRNPGFGLVKRGISSKAFFLRAGEYFVTATLPAGQEVFHYLIASEAANETIFLKPHSSGLSRDPIEEAQHFLVVCDAPLRSLSSDKKTASKKTASEEGETVKARLRLWAIDVFKQHAEDVTEKLLSERELLRGGIKEFNVEGGKNALVAQVLLPGRSALNTVLPIWQNTRCAFSVCSHSDSSFSVEPYLLSMEANAILRYDQYHHYEEAAAMLNSDMLTFPRLLSARRKDYISAVALSYAILRYDDVNMLQRWAEPLFDHASAFPDSAVIYGEYLARTGKHERALEAFVSVAKRGTPVFSAGFQYILDRLSTYVLPNRYDLHKDRVLLARTILDRLLPIAEHVDFSKPYLTFSGTNPLKPGEIPPNSDHNAGVALGL